MSHITAATQGLLAVEGRNWDEAITKLNTALSVSENPAWLIGRSKALAGLKRYSESLEDADLAWHRACDRNRRDLIAEAHYRRALAYHALRQHANADACCVYSMRVIKGHSVVEKHDPARKHIDSKRRWAPTAADAKVQAQCDSMNNPNRAAMAALQPQGTETQDKMTQAMEWRMASTARIQTLAELHRLPEDDPGRIWTTSQKPPLRRLEKREISSGPAASSTSDAGPNAAAAGGDGTATCTGPAAAGPAPAATGEGAAATPTAPRSSNIEIQDYQSQTHISVSILSKKNDEGTLKVDFSPKKIMLHGVNYPSGEQKDLTLNLWDEILPDESKYVVLQSKIELRLAKRWLGRWSCLQQDPSRRVGGLETNPSARVLDITSQEQPPRPTPEPKPKPKGEEREQGKCNEDQPPEQNSDGQASYQPGADAPSDEEQKKKEPAVAAATAQPSYPTSSRTGPKNWDKLANDEDEEEEPDVNTFFQKLFKRSSPEQQRAMMKSFTESNGTTLSTNWEDVKGRTVETTPPAGVEAKKWE